MIDSIDDAKIRRLLEKYIKKPYVYSETELVSRVCTDIQLETNYSDMKMDEIRYEVQIRIKQISKARKEHERD